MTMEETTDPVRGKLLQALRRLAPHTVRVYDSSDEHRDIAVPTRRKRWTQVIETIEARPWLRCELRAKGGAVLGYVEQREEPEGDDLLPNVPIPEHAQHMRWYLDLMLRAQTMALQMVGKEHAAMFGAMQGILEVQTQATREIVELMRQQRDAAAELATIRATANADDGLDQILKILEASPKLMQQFGPLLAGLMGSRRIAAAKPAAQPPPNGAPK
jgi:hypothetical protein